MPDVSDLELLRNYHRQGSEDAFAGLVHRHVGLVYSVAIRHAGIAAQAEEITQAVFVILARKADTLRPDTILEAWLYETTRLTSLSFLRGERRRQFREQEAFMQSTLQESNEATAWNQLAPLLDDAVARLSRKDREAVVLRFFKDKNLGEVAAAMNTTEAAAQSRVYRAVAKLQRYFMKRGVVLTSTVIAGAVATHSAQAAPAGLASTISIAAAAKGAVASASTTTLVKGTLKLMTWTKIKATVITGAAVLLAAGTTTVMIKENVFAAREPSYQGRSLVEWLPEIAFSQPQDRREKAAEAIRHMGAATLPFLLNDLMADPKLPRHRVRYIKPDLRSIDERSGQASWGFDALGPLAKPAIPELVKLLEQNPGYVPEALAGIGRDALPELLNALTNSGFFVRDNTAAALANAIYAGKITPDEASGALPVAINNLTYESTNVTFMVNTRFRATSLLGALTLEPDISVPALAAELTDSHMTLAAESARALGRFGAAGKAAVPALSKAVASTNEELSCVSVVALGQIEPSALTGNVLTQALALTKSKNGATRMRLAQAFGQMGLHGDPVVPALISLLSDPEDVVRMVAAQNLGQIGRRPNQAVPALCRGLQDPSQMVRSESATALGKFGPSARDAVSPLLAAVQADPQLKGNVQFALSQIDPKIKVR